MNKKKLSHSNLNSSITSVLAALLCIVIGMAVGFLVLLAINPAHAATACPHRWWRLPPTPLPASARSWPTAPLIAHRSVRFAFKTGLFNTCCRSVHAGR